jgi:YbbR domain-containing protein
MYNPFRNVGLKLLSVLVAILLWFAVAGEQVVERRIRAPLELQNIPEGLEIVGEPISAVDIRVRGASSTLAHLATGDVVVVLDLATAKPGRKIYPLSAEQARAPFGVELTHVSPSTASFVFEQSMSRVIPVAPSVEGDPAPGFVVERVTVEPPEVEVAGPQSALRGTLQAVTEPVSIQGAVDTVRETVTIGLPNNALKMLVPRPARLTVEIAPVPADRKFDEVPVRVKNLGPRLSFQAVPAAVTITVRGAAAAIKELDLDSVQASVDVNALGPGKYSLPVHVAGSKVFAVVRIDPSQVQVRIK